MSQKKLRDFIIDSDQDNDDDGNIPEQLIRSQKYTINDNLESQLHNRSSSPINNPNPQPSPSSHYPFLPLNYIQYHQQQHSSQSQPSYYRSHSPPQSYTHSNQQLQLSQGQPQQWVSPQSQSFNYNPSSPNNPHSPQLQQQQQKVVRASGCLYETCKLCTMGRPEILQTNTWANIMRVVFYCLHERSNYTETQGYLNLKKDIYEFMNVHWNLLTTTKSQTENWRKQIQDILSHSKDLFESGLNIRKSNGYWKLKNIHDNPWIKDSYLQYQQQILNQYQASQIEYNYPFSHHQQPQYLLQQIQNQQQINYNNQNPSSPYYFNVNKQPINNTFANFHIKNLTKRNHISALSQTTTPFTSPPSTNQLDNIISPTISHPISIPQISIDIGPLNAGYSTYRPSTIQPTTHLKRGKDVDHTSSNSPLLSHLNSQNQLPPINEVSSIPEPIDIRSLLDQFHGFDPNQIPSNVESRQDYKK